MLDERVVKRFWVKVRKGAGCWNFSAARSRFGYGQFALDGKIVPAHRVAWMLEMGPIARGLFIMHRCDNPSCVRPKHLRLATAQENQTDKALKGRSTYGAKNPNSKLTEAQVHTIDRLKARGWFHRQIAEKMGLNRSHVECITRRKYWRHLPVGA
jgi:hypothetical protein